MKRLLLLLSVAAACLRGQNTTLTPNIFLQIPAYGQTNYQVPLQYDLNLIDQYLSGVKPIPALTVTGPLIAPNFTVTSASIIASLGYTPAADPGSNGLVYRTGAGTSTAVPFPLATKGDLFGFSTVPARLAVGSDGQVPIADHTQALGIRWGISPNSTTTSDFQFTTPTFGTALMAATPATAVIAVAPNGVYGTNTKHYLYVSGTGTPEPVLITGGTCAPGGINCTITFTPANNHASGWTLSSATAGMTEAEYALVASHAAGGTVLISEGTSTVYAATPFLDNVAFQGAGIGSIIHPNSCSMTIFDANIPIKASSESALVEDNVKFSEFLIDGSSCAGINSLIGIRELNSPSSTELWSLVGLRVAGVRFNNVHYAAFLERVHTVDFLNDFTYENTVIQITDSIFTSSNGDNTAITIKNLTYNWHLLDSDGTQVTMTEAPIVCENCEVTHFEDNKMSGRPIVNTPLVNLVGGEDSQFLNNEFETFYNGIQYSAITYTDVGVVYPGYGIIVGNSFDQVWGTSINIQDGISTAVDEYAAHFTIGHNFFTNGVNGLATPILFNTGNYTTHVSLSDDIFAQLPDAGEVAVRIGEHTNNIDFGGGNHFTNDQVTVTPTVTGVVIAGTAQGVRGLAGLTFEDFTVGINDARLPIASASTITAPAGLTQIPISGTVTINSVTAQPTGTIITLLISGALTVKNGTGNLNISADFVTSGAATSTLTLIAVGPNWSKLSGAAN